MQIDEALKKGASFLIRESKPLMTAELLMAHVLEREREFVIAHNDYVLDEEQVKIFQNAVRDCSEGKPLAYITGHKEFYALDFHVDHRVLIPRPETELLVDEVLTISKEKFAGKARVLDVGTGSGNIAIAIAKNAADAEVMALEVSKDALELAKMNRSHHGLDDRLEMLQSDLLASVKGKAFDVIVANLPYIGEEKFRFVSKETVDHEPSIALFGGKDGLSLYKKMFQQLDELNVSTSFLLGELGFLQAEVMGELLSNKFAQQWTVKQDLAGIDRYFVVDLSG